MADVDKLIDAIQGEMKKITAIAPFKRTEFNGIVDSPQYPSLNFNLVSRIQFDEPSIRPSGMLMRWELTYEAQVICAALPNQTTRKHMSQMVDKATDIFVYQMQSDERLDGLAFWINTDDIVYDLVIGQLVNDKMKNVYGGIFTLTVQFTQEVCT